MSPEHSIDTFGNEAVCFWLRTVITTQDVKQNGMLQMLKHNKTKQNAITGKSCKPSYCTDAWYSEICFFFQLNFSKEMGKEGLKNREMLFHIHKDLVKHFKTSLVHWQQIISESGTNLKTIVCEHSLLHSHAS